MTVRILDQGKPHPAGWWFKFGDRFIAAHFSAEINDPRYPRCTLEIRVLDGKPTCVGITSKDGITKAILQTLPIQALVQQASVFAQVDEHPNPLMPYFPKPRRLTADGYFKRLDEVARAARARGRTKGDELDEVAYVYNNAVARAQPPKQAVIAAFPHTSLRTLDRRIRRARDTGRIPPVGMQ